MKNWWMEDGLMDGGWVEDGWRMVKMDREFMMDELHWHVYN